MGYVSSWCEGLLQNSQALKMIAQDSLIDGVEYHGDVIGINTLDEFGLKAYIHNPTRCVSGHLEDKAIVDAYKEKKKILERACGTVGMHYGRFYDTFARQEAFFDTLIENAHAVATVYPHKKFAIEQPCLDDNAIRSKSYLTSREFFNDYIAKKPDNFGYLLDIEHLFTSVCSQINMGIRSSSIDDTIWDHLEPLLPHIYEVHINRGFSHQPLGNDKRSWYFINILKQVQRSAPNLNQVVIEVDTDLNPVEHVCVIQKQAELLSN